MIAWEPHITIRALQPVVAALQALDYDADSLLHQVQISPEVLTHPEGRIPHHQMMAFWQEAVQKTQDNFLGMHLATAAPIESFEVHAYALLSSPNLREAYRRACRYQQLIHEATDLTLEEHKDEGVLRHTLPGGVSLPRHPAEFLVTLWLRFGRLVTGEAWCPRLVCFAHPAPENIQPYQLFFQAPVHFRTGRAAMHISNSTLDMVNPGADLGLVKVLDRYAEMAAKQSPRLSTVSDRVRTQLQAELNGGVPTAQNIADALCLSVRSLHRSLKREGTSFQVILDQVRQEQALALLAHPHTSIAEIAFLLGFADVSSFHRAFQRWTGTTPAKMRESLQ